MSADRKRVVKVCALIAGFSALLAFMVVPIHVFHWVMGVPFEQKLEGDMWLLIVGGSIGLVAAYFTFRIVVMRLGVFTEREAVEAWYGRKKST